MFKLNNIHQNTLKFELARKEHKNQQQQQMNEAVSRRRQGERERELEWVVVEVKKK